MPPFRVVDNPLSWFEHFDMVFIDPPHTGWSITSSEAARKKMLSVDGDVDALAESMRVWLTRHKRWGSPVYLAGESYGTTRGAALADKLQALGVSLSGVILISCAMDLQSLVFAPRNDLPYALFLPGFANTAQYHGLLKGEAGASPEAAREAAEAFVVDDYVAALHAGSRLMQNARRASRNASPNSPACRVRWWNNATCASMTRPSSSRRCARKGASSAGLNRASPARWRPAHARVGIRPRHRGHRLALHHGGAGLLRRNAGAAIRDALRSAVGRRAP